MTSQDGPTRPWEHWLVHLLWAVSARTSALGEAALADTQLTLAGLGVLKNIETDPGITAAGIARRTPQTQQTVSTIVARLERLGLVERRLVQRGEGRGIGLHLTAAGEQASRASFSAIQAFEAHLEEAIGKDRHRCLLQALEHAQPIIGELQPDSASGAPQLRRA